MRYFFICSKDIVNEVYLIMNLINIKRMRIPFIGFMVVIIAIFLFHPKTEEVFDVLYTTSDKMLNIASTTPNQITVIETDPLKRKCRNLEFSGNMSKPISSAWYSNEYVMLENLGPDNNYNLYCKFNDNSISIYKDVPSHTTEKLISWTSYPPIVFLEHLSKDCYIMFYPEEQLSQYNYWIKKFDLKTRKLSTILKKNYDWESQYGTIIHTMSTSNNNLIYTAETECSDSVSQYYIREYQSNGQLVSSIQLHLDAFMDLTNYFNTPITDVISKIKCFDNKIVLQTKHERYLFLSKKDGTWVFDGINNMLTEPLEYKSNLQLYTYMGKRILTFYNENNVLFFDIDAQEFLNHDIAWLSKQPNMTLENCMLFDNNLYCVLSDFRVNPRNYTTSLIRVNSPIYINSKS